jgi:hypothetical protein
MFEDASKFSIIVLVLLISIIVVVLTGLGILTNAIFNLDVCDSGVILPTNIIVEGKKLKLNEAEVSLSKIALITFWILIIIGLLYYVGFGLVKD